MVRVSGNGRRRRARGNMDRYPKREAVGPGQGRMGPFFVCRRGQTVQVLFVRRGGRGGEVWTEGREQEKMDDGRGINKWLSTVLLVI